MKQQVLHEEASVKRELISLAEAAPLLGIKHTTLVHLSSEGKTGFALIYMPDGSKEPLEVVKQGRIKMVQVESVRALARKSDMISRSTMRLKTMMENLGITGSTMRRHFVRESDKLYIELPSPGGRMRFEVKEASSTAKCIKTQDIPQMKRLFALLHGKLGLEDLSRDFKPENTYTVHEAAALTGLGKNCIWEMITKGTLKARMRDGRWRIKGAAIERYFEEHKGAPKDLVRMMKAAQVIGHDSRWMTRRLVKRGDTEHLEYRNDGISLSVPVHRMNTLRAFSLSELHGLKRIIEMFPLRDYLVKHWKRHADSVYERFSSIRISDACGFSVSGQRMEEGRCRLIPEYKFPDYDITLIKVGYAFLVKPEDAQAIALSILLHGSDREKIAAISELEGMEAIPERHYWIVRGAFMTTFGPLVRRLEAILANHDARRPVNPYGMVAPHDR